MSRSRYIVGIDLGTTNCAMAYVDTQGRERPSADIRDFAVPQLVAPSETALVCLVAASDAKRLVLTAPLPAQGTGIRAGIGSRAEVSWGDDVGLRMLPVELLGVQQARVPLWHFRTLGPVEQVQRRSSVRMSLTGVQGVSGKIGGRVVVPAFPPRGQGADGPCRRYIFELSQVVGWNRSSAFSDPDDRPWRRWWARKAWITCRLGSRP